jgi:hypothetical protein
MPIILPLNFSFFPFRVRLPLGLASGLELSLLLVKSAFLRTVNSPSA